MNHDRSLAQLTYRSKVLVFRWNQMTLFDLKHWSKSVPPRITYFERHIEGFNLEANFSVSTFRRSTKTLFIKFDFNRCKNEFERLFDRKNMQLIKIVFKAIWTHESIPTAWELVFEPCHEIFGLYEHSQFWIT